jgi:hypothetical protein
LQVSATRKSCQEIVLISFVLPCYFVLKCLPAEFWRETNHQQLIHHKERIMTRFSKPTFVVIALIALCALSVVAVAQTRYVVTNDDRSSGFNSATIYKAGNGTLTQVKVVSTGGTGIGGGYFSTGRVSVAHNQAAQCMYVSNAGSGNISTINATSLNLAGIFSGSSTDSGTVFGIGLALGSKALYASFTDSGTIGTFAIKPGCQLAFMGDTSAIGLQGGATDGMAVHGNMLVVSYADGSIESFDISGVTPVSNGDEQNATGFPAGNLPGGVDITSDGHFAVFGDIPTSAGFTTVEVSDISGGSLKATKVYGSDGSLGDAINSNNVALSPDETVLYISNNSSGQVTAAFFNKSTGAVTNGCVSPVMRKYFGTWFYTGSVSTLLPNGTGAPVYVAEWGGGLPSSVGVLAYHKSGSSCTLSETAYSPITDAHSIGLLTVGVYPPRPF